MSVLLSKETVNNMLDAAGQIRQCLDEITQTVLLQLRPNNNPRELNLTELPSETNLRQNIRQMLDIFRNIITLTTSSTEYEIIKKIATPVLQLIERVPNQVHTFKFLFETFKKLTL